MNETSLTCHAGGFNVAYLTYRQVAVLTASNVGLMIANINGNILVIYVLIKTEQIGNISSMLIFMLTILDLLIGAVGQSLFLCVIYGAKCLIVQVALSLSVFLIYLSFYTIALMSVDRYIRIKHYANFTTIWTIKVVSTLICVACLFALSQTVMMSFSLMTSNAVLISQVKNVMDVIVVGLIILLQIQTIRTSNAVHSESTVSQSRRFNKRVVQLSKRIILLFCFFVTPCIITVNILRSDIQDEFSNDDKSILQFIFCLSMIFFYGYSFANVVLFLMTNVKAKRHLRSFIK